MKKVKTFLLCLYLSFIPILMIILIPKLKDANLANNILGIAILIFYLVDITLIIIYGFKNLFRAKKLLKEGKVEDLKKSTKIMKIGSIPFFILNFVFTLLFLAISHGFGFLFLPVIMLYTYIILLITSIYLITLTLLHKRNGAFITNKFVLVMIMNFSFILDMLSTLIVLNKKNKISI